MSLRYQDPQKWSPKKGSKVWLSARGLQEVGSKKWEVERGVEKQSKQSPKEDQDRGR